MKRTTPAGRTAVIALLLAAPVLLSVLRAQPTRVADLLNAHATLVASGGPMQAHLEQVLFVPLSAVVVALFRLTLGFRVLGLFRPILLALAFHATGIGPGLLFLALALTIISLVRPALRGTHSFARLAILLTVISTLVLVAAALGSRLAAFPLVALCLTCETFASKLQHRGADEALARTAATVVPAIAITCIASLPGLLDWLLRHPEMLVAEIGAVLAIDRWLKLRLLSDARGPVRWPAVRLIANATDAAE